MELGRAIQKSLSGVKKGFSRLCSKYWYIPKKTIRDMYLEGYNQGIEDGMMYMSIAVENVLNENDEIQQKIIEEIQMMGLEIKYCL